MGSIYSETSHTLRWIIPSLLYELTLLQTQPPMQDHCSTHKGILYAELRVITPKQAQEGALTVWVQMVPYGNPTLLSLHQGLSHSL